MSETVSRLMSVILPLFAFHLSQCLLPLSHVAAAVAAPYARPISLELGDARL